MLHLKLIEASLTNADILFIGSLWKISVKFQLNYISFHRNYISKYRTQNYLHIVSDPILEMERWIQDIIGFADDRYGYLNVLLFGLVVANF